MWWTTERLGKTVRYQMAYNKPFCEEEAAVATDIPETESLGLGHEVDVLAALQPGTNKLVARVYTNLSNLLDKGAHQRYGLFGPVVLLTA